MNTETNVSLIHSALTEMAAKRSIASARLAELAQQQNHASPVTLDVFGTLAAAKARRRADFSASLNRSLALNR